MRMVQKIPLLVLAVIAAMAVAAGSASAQEVEVVSEPDPSLQCVAATGACEVTVEGESHIVALPSGVEVSSCEDTFHVEFNHDGTGHVHWTGVPHRGAGCNITNCTVMSPEWPISNPAEVAAGTMSGNVTFCLRSGTTELECTVRGDGTDGSEPHHYLVTATAICAGGARRVEFSGETDVDQNGSHSVEALHH